GTYTCTITDAGGCVQTQTVTLTQPGALNASVTSTNAGCLSATGSATVTASGGTGALTYSWTPSGGSAATAGGLAPGTYTCTITDANGCSKPVTTTITTNTAPTVSVASHTNLLCNGSSTGNATLSVSGGTTPYTFSWSPTGGNAISVSGLGAGTYTCTISDAGGCVQTQTVTITQPTAIAASSTSVSATCGSSNGSATATGSGGTGTWTYSWSPSGGNTSQATNLSAGIYTCTITDANGCSQTTSVAVNNSGGQTVTLSAQTNPLCNGSSTGSATVAVSGGTSPYTYSWSPSGGTGATATGLSAGTYTCIVKDASGCIQTQLVTITQPPVLTASATGIGVQCNGLADGTAIVNATGGTSPYTYSWSPSGGNAATASGLTAGIYTCIIADAGGCLQAQTVTITQPALLSMTLSTQVLCGKNNGQASASPSGGSPAYTYSWTPSGATTSTVSGLTSGTYSCTVTDANGCTKSSGITVLSDTNTLVTVSHDTTLIYGNSILLQVNGTGTYSWSPSSSLSCSTCPNPIASPISTTEYCAIGLDNFGCRDTACVKVMVDFECGTIYVPNYFSPNSDGMNDFECVYGKCIETLDFAIYDRWGEKVFETNDMAVCWDGIFRGQPMNTAVFVYYLKATLANGQVITQKGNLTLQR
ncbi:MAG TPA: gliding motility-associated C-terminal domain-containing protein, partial [Bacteroidia bacterium]|nr:gliding motility-associated C-terminal domain-containing protein [Bacteroidia bacterium]